MSGGSYNYVYSKIADAADEICLKGNCSCTSPALRKAFAKHMRLVAKAMRAIEWNDSGDGDDREDDLIRACLPKNAELSAAILLAVDAKGQLEQAIAAA